MKRNITNFYGTLYHFYFLFVFFLLFHHYDYDYYYFYIFSSPSCLIPKRVWYKECVAKKLFLEGKMRKKNFLKAKKDTEQESKYGKKIRNNKRNNKKKKGKRKRKRSWKKNVNTNLYTSFTSLSFYLIYSLFMVLLLKTVSSFRDSTSY